MIISFPKRWVLRHKMLQSALKSLNLFHFPPKLNTGVQGSAVYLVLQTGLGESPVAPCTRGQQGQHGTGVPKALSPLRRDLPGSAMCQAPLKAPPGRSSGLRGSALFSATVFACGRSTFITSPHMLILLSPVSLRQSGVKP